MARATTKEIKSAAKEIGKIFSTRNKTTLEVNKTNAILFETKTETSQTLKQNKTFDIYAQTNSTNILDSSIGYETNIGSFSYSMELTSHSITHTINNNSLGIDLSGGLQLQFSTSYVNDYNQDVTETIGINLSNIFLCVIGARQLGKVAGSVSQAVPQIVNTMIKSAFGF